MEHTSRPIFIVKADGSEEAFDGQKLKQSLKRSGADEETARTITAHIEAEIHDGITTEAIYRHARSLLKKRETTTAAKYSLRRALFSLGPTGFPFEHFLAELYRAHGYQTQTGTVVTGACVQHEIDLIAYKSDHCFIAEAKFHSRPGVRSDLQVALYSYARFLDVQGKKISAEHSCSITEGYIITNTKFTKTAIEYAECVGLKLLSWNYPRGNTLQDFIEQAGIYPITTLPSLSLKEKRLLLERGVVLCKDLAKKRDIMRSIGISAPKIERIVAEGLSLCTSH